MRLLRQTLGCVVIIGGLCLLRYVLYFCCWSRRVVYMITGSPSQISRYLTSCAPCAPWAPRAKWRTKRKTRLAPNLQASITSSHWLSTKNYLKKQNRIFWEVFGAEQSKIAKTVFTLTFSHSVLLKRFTLTLPLTVTKCASQKVPWNFQTQSRCGAPWMHKKKWLGKTQYLKTKSVIPVNCKVSDNLNKLFEF